jgi:hypothetical protein
MNLWVASEYPAGPIVSPIHTSHNNESVDAHVQIKFKHPHCICSCSLLF